MNRCLLLFLCLFLVSCHEKQIDEPYYELEYDLEGEHYYSKDMGVAYRGLFGSHYESLSEGAMFQFRNIDDSTRVALFSFAVQGPANASNKSHYLSFDLPSESPFFFERRKYTYQMDSLNLFRSPVTVNYKYCLTNGTFSFSRVKNGGYGRYLFSFDFDCASAEGDTLRFRYGQVLLCNRLIKERGNERVIKMILHEL
jgi:hypothetical protein